MRRRRPDIDADRPQAQPLCGDIGAEVIRIVVVMTVMCAGVRMGRGQ